MIERKQYKLNIFDIFGNTNKNYNQTGFFGIVVI